MTGAPASQDGLSSLRDEAAEASSPKASIPCAGDWIVRRRHSRWAWADFSAYLVQKTTDKTCTAIQRTRPERIPLHEVVAVLPDKESAERLVQSLDGVVGTYRQKANVADREYSERKRQAADAADKAADRLIAKARGEAQ